MEEDEIKGFDTEDYIYIYHISLKSHKFKLPLQIIEFSNFISTIIECDKPIINNVRSMYNKWNI